MGSMKNSGFNAVSSSFYDEGVTRLGDLEFPIDTLIVKGVKE